MSFRATEIRCQEYNISGGHEHPQGSTGLGHR